MSYKNQRGIPRVFLLMIALASLLIWHAEATESAAEGPETWLEVEIGIVGTASDDILKSAMQEVREKRYDGLVIKLDTPGGALDATRAMVKDIMGAEFPVVVWVGPSGSRAGSAGAFITLAGHIAAMASGTNIGAAKPISASGEDLDGKQDISKKIQSDTEAFMESIAKSRGRNEEVAISFVVSSTSITAEEALELDVIDFIANDLGSLMEKIDGQEITLQSGRTVKLATKAARLVAYKTSLRQDFLTIISNPNLFYLLFLAGMIGIGFELTHPGSIFPGVIGGVSMILALVATSVLPVSFGAMLLIFAGVSFIVAEAFLPSFGVLGIGGLAAFVIGSVLLVDPGNEQGLQISWLMIVPAAVTVGAISLGIGYLVFRADRSQVKSGRSAMIGLQARALVDFAQGHGRIFVNGENWEARAVEAADSPMIQRNDMVRVARVEGLVLFVEKI